MAGSYSNVRMAARRWPAWAALGPALLAIGCAPHAEHSAGALPGLPPLPVLSPTALTADAGDQKAYLRWNLQIADGRVVGWRVVQLAPQERTVTAQVLREPHYVATGLANGTACTFAVVGVLTDGATTPPSNTVTVVPRPVAAAKVARLRKGEKLAVGRFQDVQIGGAGVRIAFPDGQQLVYDRYRPIAWKAADGEQLLYPGHFGNGLDVGRFDKRGLPVVVPPGGLKADTVEAGGRTLRLAGPAEREYLQRGSKHPHITDPLTLPLDRRWHDAPPRWFAPAVDGDRVTLRYWQPLVLHGYRAWQYVLVWETWWPIERELHGTTYRGLARMIEVQMPSSWRAGYQVMLNNGFGPGGSRDGVVSYGTGYRSPGREIVDFSGPANRQVAFQSSKPPRRGSLYHPNHDSLQSSPLIFYDWDRPGARGSLLIAARSLYYHCTNGSATYVEQGADGVWPNLAWDLARAGRRTHVDTVEYLYASRPTQALPQRFVNARFWAYGNVSRRMGVQDRIAAVCTLRPHGEVKRAGGPRAYADKYVRQARDWGVDSLDTPLDFWISLPITADDRWRNDPQYADNADIRRMCDTFHKAGYKVGYWLRAELVTTSIANALSETIPTAETFWGFAWCNYPEAVKALAERGMPELRGNGDWVRRQIDGTWPAKTPYQWVPMSLASGWHDRIIWPALRTAAKLGFACVLVDGGFAGMQGVDYSPMLAGRADAAVPMQPFWWRFWRTMEHVGIRPYGECTMGWRGGNVFVGGAGDEHYPWMFQMGWYREKPATGEFLHRLHQLYNGTEFRRDDELLPIRRYAVRFHRRHPRPPDRIELRDIRRGEEVEITVRRRDAPATGLFDKSRSEGEVKLKCRPWTWSDAIWHYSDGTSVVYPAYDKIDWKKQ